MAKAFGTRLIERGERGKVIMVSSTKGRHGSPAGYTAYSTSKGATDALVRVLATEWGKHGINVNAIAPTVFRSALTGWIFEDTERGAKITVTPDAPSNGDEEGPVEELYQLPRRTIVLVRALLHFHFRKEH